MNGESSAARAAALLSSTTSSSFAVRARALRTLEEHRAGMSRSAELVARSRALCDGAEPGAWAPPAGATAPALTPAPGAPAGRPALRLVPGGAASPARAPECTHLGCFARTTVAPQIVVRFSTREVAVPGLPLRVCPVHAADLAALARTDAFREALRGRLRRRGHEEPVAVRFAFLPIQ